MTKGLFCIWSRADPDSVAQIKPDETFSDAVSELPGVSLGTQVKLMSKQVMDPPFSHDIPYLSMYDLPDVEYRHDPAFQEVVKASESRAEGACKPRIYEEIHGVDVEGCEDIHPRIGDNISVVTCEPPRPEQADEFWKWQMEVYLPMLRDGPTALRTRVYKEVGEATKESVMPSAPYLFVFEWEDDDLPWIELTTAAQSKEWAKYIEGGLIWQGMCYHTKRYTEKFETTLSPGYTDQEDANSSIDSRSLNGSLNGD